MILKDASELRLAPQIKLLDMSPIRQDIHPPEKWYKYMYWRPNGQNIPPTGNYTTAEVV